MVTLRYCKQWFLKKAVLKSLILVITEKNTTKTLYSFTKNNVIDSGHLVIPEIS